MSTENITNVADFRANLSDFLDKVNDTGEPVIIVRHGEPVAVVVSPKVWDSLEKHARRKKFDELSKEIEKHWKGANKNVHHTQEEIDSLSY